MSANDPTATTAPPARSGGRLWIVGLLAALFFAGGLSYYASASPDGLEKVAADHGIDRMEKEHAAEGSPLADYELSSVGNSRLSGGLAGVIGVGATLAVGSGLFWVVRRRPARQAEGAPLTGGATGQG
nr:PDGLE domain-containing protein [Streptomyces sp. TP-A0874]